MKTVLVDEVQLFFEYEKTDSFEEFILNFEPFFNNAQNKAEIIQQLILLFKREKKELNKTKNEYFEAQYLFQVHKQIKGINKIISYLQDKKDAIKPKKQKILKDKRVEKVVVKTIKKENKKINKSKRAFSNETLEIAELIEKGYELEELKKDEISNLIQYYQYKKENAIKNKLSIQNQDNHERLDDSYQEIKRYTNILNELIKRKRNYQQIEEVEETKEQHFKLPISSEQLKSLYCYLKMDIIEIDIDDINSEDNIAKLNELYNLLVSKEKQLLRTKKNLYEKRSKLRELNDENLINEITNEINKFNIHMNVLNNLLNYLKHYQKNNYRKINDNLLFLEEVEINEVQSIVENKLLEGSSIEEYQLIDILYGLGHYIKYDGVIDSKLLKTTRSIFDKCLNLTISDENELGAIYYIWDAIKYRLKNVDKEDLKTRDTLKDIRILFDYLIKNYKVDNAKFKHNYYFDIIDYFLKNENDYSYIKKLIKNIPDIVNVRKTVDVNGEKNSEHIIFHILSTFITNYRKLLLNKQIEHINKDYLKSIYLLFIRNYNIYLTSEEKNRIDKMLAAFMHEANITLTSSRRKNAVREDLRDMYTHKMYRNDKCQLLEDIIENKLEQEMNSMFLKTGSALLSTKRIDLRDECSFIIGSGYHAYSISKLDDKTILKVHVIDIYDIFTKNSQLEKYLYNQTLSGEEVDSFILRQLVMTLNHDYPTITYEIEFDSKGNYKRKNGHINQFKIYQSKITPKVYYNEHNLIYTKGDVVLKEFNDLYRTSLIKNHGDYCNQSNLLHAKAYFEEIVNQGVTEYFKFNQLPFIYSGLKTVNNDTIVRHMNDLSHILSRLKEEEFKAVYSILNSEKDEFHYSIKEFEGVYQLQIQNPISSVGLMIQRVLHEMVFDNRHNEEEYEQALKKFKKEMQKLITCLNHYNDYVDVDVLNENKDKIILKS